MIRLTGVERDWYLTVPTVLCMKQVNSARLGRLLWCGDETLLHMAHIFQEGLYKLNETNICLIIIMVKLKRWDVPFKFSVQIIIVFTLDQRVGSYICSNRCSSFLKFFTSIHPSAGWAKEPRLRFWRIWWEGTSGNRFLLVKSWLNYKPLELISVGSWQICRMRSCFAASPYW